MNMPLHNHVICIMDLRQVYLRRGDKGIIIIVKPVPVLSDHAWWYLNRGGLKSRFHCITPERSIDSLATRATPAHVPKIIIDW